MDYLDSCYHNNCCSCWNCCNTESEQKEYGFFYDSSIYNTALYGGLNFTKPPIKTDKLYIDDNIITIFKAGVYLVSYLVHFPAQENISTILSLQVNGNNYPGTIRIVDKEEGYLYTEAAQTILIVENITSMRLSSSEILNIIGTENDTLVSLAITQL